MIPTSLVLKLIKGLKSNDQRAVDSSIREIIQIAENKNQKKLASELRSLNGLIIPNTTSEPIIKPNSINLHKESLYTIRESNIKLSDVVLANDVENQVYEVIENFSKRDVFLKKGVKLGNKLLLYGRPGTGKTMLAYAIAGELNIPIVHVYLDELISSYLGETGKNIREIFQSNRSYPSIIFLDEFDTIAKKRDDSQELGELKRVVTVLLQNIDDLDNENLLIGATNHEHLLDSAIWRRFDYQLHIDLPTREAREQIILKILNDVDQSEVDTTFLSYITNEMSGADIQVLFSKILRNQIIHKSTDVYAEVLKYVSKKSNKSTIKEAVFELKKKDPKKYTYKKLESLTGISHSTINSWLKK